MYKKTKALNGHSKALNAHSKALNAHSKALNRTFKGKKELLLCEPAKIQ